MFSTLRRTDSTTCSFLRGPTVVPETTNGKTQGQEDTTIDANYELRQEETASRILVQRATQQVIVSHILISHRCLVCPLSYCNLERKIRE